MKKSVHRGIAFVLGGIFCLSCIMAGYKLLEYQNADEDNREAQEAVESTVPEIVLPEPEIAEPQPEIDPLADDPNVKTLWEIDFAALKETNADVIGWILIPDTPINYPILQTDNNDYYLSHTWKKNYNAGGSIFMEQFCSGDLSDFNTIIYGHRMINDSMFGSLKYYNRLEYWEEHPLVYIATPQGICQYEIFAAMEPGIRDVTYRLGITEEETRQAFLDFTDAHNQIDTGIIPTPEDRILTLSTCTGRGHDTRWVVQGRLLHETLTE